MTIKKDHNLLPHNTFGIEAKCSQYIDVFDEAELKEALAIIRQQPDQPIIVLGGGSNLLLTQDFKGTVLHVSIHGMECQTRTETDVFLRCGAGEPWDKVVEHCVENSWYGTENLSLIPGEVGATAVQNIGAYGMEVAQLIESIEAVEISTGLSVVIRGDECGYGYRQSKFKNEWKGKYVITHVTYKLSKAFAPLLDYGNIKAQLAAMGIEQPTPKQLRQLIIDIRRTKLPDPEVTGNAGSFFMNPVVKRSHYEQLLSRWPGLPKYDIDEEQVKIPAARLIELCGWKGKQLGNAGVHHRQPLVLVNLGKATGSEVVELCNAIRHDVMENFGIDLKPEVNII